MLSNNLLQRKRLEAREQAIVRLADSRLSFLCENTKEVEELLWARLRTERGAHLVQVAMHDLELRAVSAHLLPRVCRIDEAGTSALDAQIRPRELVSWQLRERASDECRDVGAGSKGRRRSTGADDGDAAGGEVKAEERTENEVGEEAGVDEREWKAD